MAQTHSFTNANQITDWTQEIMELDNHPFFIGVQFHPELKSTPENPHPLFVALVKAAIKKNLS